ncbi:4'-phosphopantetheinyl transferase family protein [Terrabacter sp. GCM10028922]|uniref:4'-phosphopantetheinyl transferase family protein n=1 Tax=Terrabacter sp. GCM10028922 TaxID=3273428 RepID=UPI003609005A
MVFSMMPSVVDLWVRQTSAVLADNAGAGATLQDSVLDHVERQRWDRFADVDAARSYAAGHLLARTQIGRLLSHNPATLRFDRTCDDCGEQHGRPRLLDDPSVHLSLSRTPSLVAVALSRSGPVGVDVEPHAAASFAGYVEVALHPDDRAFDADGRRDQPSSDVTAWVRKEAALKALGVGLRVDPASVRTPSTGLSEELVAGLPRVTVVDVPVDDAYAVAVAVALGPGVVEVRQH